MSEECINKDIRKNIIQNTYKCFRKKERDSKTKASTISDIIKMIKDELTENAN